MYTVVAKNEEGKGITIGDGVRAGEREDQERDREEHGHGHGGRSGICSSEMMECRV